MSLPRLLTFTLLVLASIVLTRAYAQERAASQPFHTDADVTNTALLQKISYLNQVVSVLQGQLRAYQTGTPLPTTPLPENKNGDLAPQQAASEDDSPSSRTLTTFHDAPAVRTVPAAPLVRTGGYQAPAPQSRLTCADYSPYYFSRHPAMSAVCAATAPETVSAPLAVTATTVSTTAITSTTHLRTTQPVSRSTLNF